MLLAVPDVQELHSNLKILLGELGLEMLDFVVTSDIKIGTEHSVCRIITYPNMVYLLSSIVAGKRLWILSPCLPLLRGRRPVEHPQQAQHTRLLIAVAWGRLEFITTNIIHENYLVVDSRWLYRQQKQELSKYASYSTSQRRSRQASPWPCCYSWTSPGPR